MEIWHIWILASMLLFIIEMGTPALFFASIALGCLAGSIFAFFGANILLQFAIFTITAVCSILFVRPLFLNKRNGKTKTGVQEKYIEKIAQAVTEITADSGRIKIYGEEWQAKSLPKEIIPEGSRVKIIKNESLIMYVIKQEEN